MPAALTGERQQAGLGHARGDVDLQEVHAALGVDDAVGTAEVGQPEHLVGGDGELARPPAAASSLTRAGT